MKKTTILLWFCLLSFSVFSQENSASIGKQSYIAVSVGSSIPLLDFKSTDGNNAYAGFAKSGTGVVAINTWLHDLMNTIPPAVWVAATGVSASKTLELLGQHAEMRSALVQASINNNDDTFAEILLAFCSGEQWHALLGMLPEGRREVLIMGNAAYQNA